MKSLWSERERAKVTEVAEIFLCTNQAKREEIDVTAEQWADKI